MSTNDAAAHQFIGRRRRAAEPDPTHPTPMSSHVSDTAYVRFAPAAVGVAGMLIPAGARMWLHRPEHLGLAPLTAPPVLAFDVSRAAPPLRAARDGPALDLGPFERFFREHVGTQPFREDDVPSLDENGSAIARGLDWLSRTLAAPVSYWHHYGCDGLLYEYFWGFSPAGAPTLWFNDEEAVDVDDTTTAPASAFTAALWHLGIRCPNRDEGDWFHHHRPGRKDLAEGKYLRADEESEGEGS